MDLDHRPSTAELTAELDGTARRALDARVPFASRKEVERYSQLLPNLYDDRGPIEYPTTRITAPPPEPSLPDSDPESDQRAAPATGARMPEGGSQHTRSVEGLSVGNAWSGSALVSGFSARDESSAFIPGWDTPPMVANWSYYKRGWRNGTSTTTDPVWMDLDHVPPSRIASNQLEDRGAAVWASKQILKRREAELDADVARRDAVLAHRARARGRLHDTHLIRHASQESLVTTNYCYSLPTTYAHYPLPNTYYHYLLPLPTTY